MRVQLPESRLERLHAAWVSNGRPAQKGVEWSRAAWCRALPARATFFEGLPDRIDRAVVSKHFSPCVARSNATETFLVAMVWGHGSTGYGAWRTHEILVNCPDSAARLLDVYETSRESPVEAYRSMGYHRRNRLVGLGPAFGTKFISFAAGSNGAAAPILDALTAAWVARYSDETFAPAVWRPTEYARYLDLVSAWAAQLGEPVSDTEYLMFADASKHLSRGRRRTNQWAESWVPDLDSE